MPMIEFRYRGPNISDEQAFAIGSELEEALRNAIKHVRPSKGAYGVSVEGDPFGPIARNQPDLRIYVFYHDDWSFAKRELDQLAYEMGREVTRVLRKAEVICVIAKIRFYARTGHASETVS